jgi:hypothetical protein
MRQEFFFKDLTAMVVTIIWLLGFIYMFIQGIIASIWLPVEVWSWVVNTGNRFSARVMVLNATFNNISVKRQLLKENLI